MRVKDLFGLILILCILFCGCSKKKQAEKIDNTEIENVASEEKSDDIFDEFYEDEGEKKTESEPEEFRSSSSTPDFNPDGRYVVQVSCVLSKRLAEDVVAKLENKGYPTYIAEVDNPTADLIGRYQRIRIGGFSGVSQAKNFAENYLVQDGYEFWVDNRSNDNVGMGGYEGLGESSGYESATPSQPTNTWEDTDPAPAVESSTPATPAVPEVQATPVQEPAAPQPVTPAPAATPETSTPPPAGDVWEEADDEWGSDTTGW
jgi:hypothetical protein